MTTAPQGFAAMPPMNALMPAEEPACRRDRLWSDCRNGLGIARLLVHEGRPEGLVSTACRVAVESACRAALAHLGLPYDGDLDRALRDLKVEAEWCASVGSGVADRSLLLAAERTVGSIAAFLREAEPARSWGY
jgi:hypothetical protein